MPEVTAEQAGALHAEIRRLQHRILGRDQVDATLAILELDEVLEPIETAGEFDEAKWSALGVDAEEVAAKLVALRTVMRSAAALDGPLDPSSPMYDDYASKWAVYALAALSFIVAVVILVAVAFHWCNALGGVDHADLDQRVERAVAAVQEFDRARSEENATKPDSAGGAGPLTRTSNPEDDVAALEIAVAEQRAKVAYDALLQRPTEVDVLLMVILLGALGGALHMLASTAWFIGNRQLKKSWVTFYLYLPVRGALLAPLVYLLLRVGLLSTPSATGDGIRDLNLLGIYAIAGLTGLFAEKATDKLAEVFGTMFRTEAKSKDKAGVQETSTKAAP